MKPSAAPRTQFFPAQPILQEEILSALQAECRFQAFLLNTTEHGVCRLALDQRLHLGKDDWEGLTWHIQESAYFNDLPALQKRPVWLHRLCRQQHKVNQMLLHSIERCRAILDARENIILRHLGSGAMEAELNGFDGHLELAWQAQRAHPGPHLLARWHRRQQEINFHLSRMLQALARMLVSQSTRLDRVSPQSFEVAEFQRHLAWHVAEPWHLYQLNQRLPAWQQRWLRPQGEINRLHRCSLELMAKILQTDHERLSLLLRSSDSRAFTQ